MTSDVLLSLEGLRVAVRSDGRWVPALNEVSLRLEAGRALGLVGESGSGKSLTALSIPRLLPESDARTLGGSVRFRGEELTSASPRRLRELRGREIALVLQDPMTALNPVRSLGAQLIEQIRQHRGLSAKAARQLAIELLRSVGIPSPERRVDSHPHELSGGMRQRALIAAALSCDPSLLIADEPTTALDVTVQAQILALLDGERRRRSMALLLVSHDLAVVAQTCDDVAVMYAGRVVEQGPVARVFAAPAHPYTAGLLRSVRSIQRREGGRQRLVAIPGTVPSLDEVAGRGCSFRGRCEGADGLCERTTPSWSDAGGRGVACHRPLAPGRAAAASPGVPVGPEGP